MKRFLEFWIAFCWAVIVAIVWGWPASAQIAGGANTTDDSGKVHIIGNATTQNGVPTLSLTTYSSSIGTALPTEPQPGFGMVHPVAKGIPNDCKTLFWFTAGGGTAPFLGGTNPLWDNGTQWNALIAFASSPSPAVGNPRYDYGLAEGVNPGTNGVATGGCVNVIYPQYLLNSAQTLDANITSGSSSFVSDGGANWPQSGNFVATFNDSSLEDVLVTTVSGTAFMGPYTNGSLTRGYNGTTAASHTAGTWITLKDTSGIPASDPDTSLCSIAALASYVATQQDLGNLPGHKWDWYFGGWSYGARLAVNADEFIHSLIKSGRCPQNPTNDSFVIKKVVVASLPADLCVTTQVYAVDQLSPAPYNQTMPFHGESYGVALTGANATNPANFSTIDQAAAHYSITGMPLTGKNTACDQARIWSPQFNQPTNCLNPAGCDAKPAPISGIVGDVDEQIGGVQQANFYATSTIPVKAMFIVNGYHGANLTTCASGSGNGGMCADGVVSEWITQELYSPPTVTSTPMTVGGAY